MFSMQMATKDGYINLWFGKPGFYRVGAKESQPVILSVRVLTIRW